MTSFLPSFRGAPAPGLSVRLALMLALVLATTGTVAERADRYQPLNFSADALRYDDLKQVNVLTGNVVITKGTMTLRAARVEVHQTPSGHQSAVAFGGGQNAYFRQKRDAVDEYIEGEAGRIEYDGRNDTVRLVGAAVVRRYRGPTLADEIKGQTIHYDNLAETFTVQGGEGDGRVRGTLSPRDAPPPAQGAGQ
ncbi:MAG TPA: lipopolysaccharide transport periplasmic protein LptA [Burkholderiaceae bacterium]|nr:lipopolysaccharide transport periplasmic protein LptA [Burkholderiaceae bacterium]